MRVLIIDDERLARERLARLLRAWPDIEVAGEAADGIAALDVITGVRPDAVFLDVQMPGLNGFEVLAELPAAERPMVVFVTAYDQYAVQAFEVNAVDYVMKPVDEERLGRCISKLRDHSAREGIERLLAATRKSQTIRRVVGKKLQRLHVLPADSIEAFLAEDELVFAVTAGGRFLVNRTLRDLEAGLDPERFSRVHKGAIVNLEKLTVLEPASSGGATARLECGEVVEISRRYAQALREKLGW
jgi:two-component system LytT family response regulator